MVKEKENDLKKDYEALKKKYNLPEFKKMSEDFYIEKIRDYEKEFLIREIRRFMSEKLNHYMKFVEVLINPVNASAFIFSVVKVLGPTEKNKLVNLYKTLSKFEMDLIKLDLDYSEKSEADFIKKTYSEWDKMKKELIQIVDFIESNWNTKIDYNNKGYFG